MQQEGDNPSDMASGLALCIQPLVNEGRAAVSAHPPAADDADAVPVLTQLDGFARDELALELPEYSPAAAVWAARLFYQLCRFIVCRDIPETEINAACAVPCPEPRNPSTDWSADLTLRHLPRLFQLARHLSNGDPLVERMKKIATSWPLSSVGISGLENLDLKSFIQHPALRRLYGDRVLAAGDLSRLGDARLDDLLRADIGIHRELAPAFATKLFEPTHDTN